MTGVEIILVVILCFSISGILLGLMALGITSDRLTRTQAKREIMFYSVVALALFVYFLTH